MNGSSESSSNGDNGGKDNAMGSSDYGQRRRR